MAGLVVYDKKTCGTCKKAKAFLDKLGVEYTLKNIETEPPPPKVLEHAIKADDVKSALNSRSNIYREKQLSQNLPDKPTAIRLMEEDPNLIKRPFIVREDGDCYMGFNETTLKAFVLSSGL